MLSHARLSRLVFVPRALLHSGRARLCARSYALVISYSLSRGRPVFSLASKALAQELTSSQAHKRTSAQVHKRKSAQAHT
jgi:hypothetical protein